MVVVFVWCTNRLPLVSCCYDPLQQVLPDSISWTRSAATHLPLLLTFVGLLSLGWQDDGLALCWSSRNLCNGINRQVEDEG